ncbi:MAG: hypothetical protein IKE70_00845 [Bacilli bacterium]|nr:hypothetical protein [Bacilli bacterium]
MINQNKKMNLREKDRRGKIMIAILLLIAIIGVGYAALGANLKINGVANIPSASWNVHFKTGSIAVTSGSVTGTNVTTVATITNLTQVDYSVKLALPGDFYEFTVIAENTGTIDAMIDSVVSKRGETVITTGTLPSYIDYSVTYADGVAIAPKQILAASTEETYKVRIAYKTDIEASELPGATETLNLNFQINYVQADDTAVAVDHSVTMYGVYPQANQLYLNQAIPSNAILHSTPSEALADWTNPSVMNIASQMPFYLKHKIENDVVTESYVVFTVTPDMAQANPGMTAGTYELRGEKTYANDWLVDENYVSPYYEENKETIKTVFGYSTNSSNCEETGTGRSSKFSCYVSEHYGVSRLFVHADAAGSVGVDADSDCFVSFVGSSQCRIN